MGSGPSVERALISSTTDFIGARVRRRGTVVTLCKRAGSSPGTNQTKKREGLQVPTAWSGIGIMKPVPLSFTISQIRNPVGGSPNSNLNARDSGLQLSHISDVAG